MRKTRVFTAFFVSYMAFFFLYAGVAWLLTFLKITPYGEFVATFFKGRTPEDAKAFIEANRELFSKMLPEAARFSNLFITPSVGFAMGVLMGLITTEKGHNRASTGILWSLIAALPVGIFFWARSGAEPDRAMYLIIFLVVTALGGFIGNRIAVKAYAGE